MPFNQPLKGLIEPTGDAWEAATPLDRLAFYKQAGDVAVGIKRAELARAIGRNGRRMKARKHPRPDGATGPVLTPHREASRTARLLAFRATPTGLTLFWHSGIGRTHDRPWGTILGYHADGKVKGAPKRDVRLSTRGIGKARSEMATWWARRVDAAERRRMAEEASKPAPRPRKSIIRKIQEKLVARYRGLRDYFRDPGDGF